MQTGFVEIKVLAMRTTIGQGESLARVNSFGFANLVEMLTRTINTVIFASKSMLMMVQMLILMVKSGLSVKNVQSGFTQCVRLRMVIKIYLIC